MNGHLQVVDFTDALTSWALHLVPCLCFFWAFMGLASHLEV